VRSHLRIFTFAWRAAMDLRLDESVDNAGARIFHLHGPLFFASARQFKTRIKTAKIPEHTVIFDFSLGQVLDLEAVSAIAKAMEQMTRLGKRCCCQGLPTEVEGHSRMLAATGEAKLPEMDPRRKPLQTSTSPNFPHPGLPGLQLGASSNR